MCQPFQPQPWCPRSLRHLRHCIVLSIRGDRPESSKMFGADYDGDKAFALWDRELMRAHAPEDPQSSGASKGPFEGECAKCVVALAYHQD